MVFTAIMTSFQCGNSTMQSANVSDENKSERVENQHLEKHVRELTLYQEMVRESKGVMETEESKPGIHAPASKEITMHYTFPMSHNTGDKF